MSYKYDIESAHYFKNVWDIENLVDLHRSDDEQDDEDMLSIGRIGFKTENSHVFMFEIIPNLLNKDVDIICSVLSKKSKNKFKKMSNFKYDVEDGLITCTYESDGKSKQIDFIRIRGWGQLHSKSGFGLTENQSIRVQDTFAMYVVSTLNDLT